VRPERFMPGIHMERTGPVHHNQGTVLSDWVAKGAEGKVMMSGANVFQFAMGKIASVTGIANPPRS
jgi:hypothetical protein